MWFVKVQATLFCISATPVRSMVAPQLWYFFARKINSFPVL